MISWCSHEVQQPFVRRINYSPGSQAILEVTSQEHFAACSCHICIVVFHSTLPVCVHWPSDFSRTKQTSMRKIRWNKIVAEHVP